MPHKALYMIRFDDICPTMNWTIWNEIERIVDQAGVKPILAVVPDNQDPKLMVDPPMSDFWDKVRTWQDKGYTIAIHGFQHKYETDNAGIMRLNKYSEFAGLTEQDQEHKLLQAVTVFRDHGITTNLWVAPAHSFDQLTLRVLKRLGINIISDGFAINPFRTDDQLIWIPQQLWGFNSARHGVWTVCYHHNCWNAQQLRAFEKSVLDHQPAFTSVDAILHRDQMGSYTAIDRVYSFLLRNAITIKNRLLRELLRKAARLFE